MPPGPCCLTSAARAFTALKRTPGMSHHRQWSAVFASYFAILGLWTSFGPHALIVLDPGAAPLALAAIALSYFVATPLAHQVWMRLGFARAVTCLGAGVACFLALCALVPAWLVWCAPLALLLGSGAYTLCETRMIEVLAQEGRGHEFGRARKWGSFGFLLAAAAGGAVLSSSGVGRIFLLALAVCALAFLLCCLGLGRVYGKAGETPQQGHAGVAEVHATPQPARQQAPSPFSGRALGGCGAIAGMRLAESISVTWFGAYWLQGGHSPLQTGLLCALPVAAEFVAMWKGGPLMARLGAPAVMCLCCLVSALRWAATPWCSDLACAVPLQALHAFSVGFFYPASLLWQKSTFGERFFFARYVTESLSRALAAVLVFAAARWVLASYGYMALYSLSAVLALLAGLWWLRATRATASADFQPP